MNEIKDGDVPAAVPDTEVAQNDGHWDQTADPIGTDEIPTRICEAGERTAKDREDLSSLPVRELQTTGPANSSTEHDDLPVHDSEDAGHAPQNQEHLDQLKARINELSETLAEGTAERRQLLQEVEEQIQCRIENEKALKRAQQEIRKNERMSVEQAEEIDRLKTAASKLRKRNRSMKESLNSFEEQLEAAQRVTKSMKRRVNRLESRCAGYDQVDFALNWLAKGLGTDAMHFPKLLATIGSNPFPSRQFDNHLLSKEFELVWPGNGDENEDVEIMIVGRSGWNEEQLEQQLAAREGQELRVYSQEMFLLSLAANRDMLDEFSAAQLETIANHHPALKFLSESELEWPRRIVPVLPSEFRPFDADGRVDASPLHVMGYAVGKTHGRPASERHRLLSQAFEGNIPWVDSEQYMSDWGRPRTRRRLWRIANHLGWLARSWKRLPSHRVAVTDWVSDLTHLKRSYYRPWMRFKWPEVRVPGD